MKKMLLLTALVVLFAVPAMAAIKDTKHNLGTTGKYTYRSTNGTTQICIFCHTPHNPVQNVPLWNRSNAGGAYKSYTSSNTLNAERSASLTSDSISLFCLSCHDGSLSIPAQVRNWAAETQGSNFYVNRGTGSKTNIGGDGAQLSNDHPVNFNYDLVQTADAYFKVASNTGLRFFKSSGGTGKTAGPNYLECATCHDPHGIAGVKKFLRKKNDSSSLCLSCHQK